MKDVFISRPTWLPSEFEDGLNNFLGFLESKDLKPRTLGSTDYPTECPLDEVLAIMKQCVGAVILGYPQITISKGTVKDEEITTELTLATEWNHIEAGLAHAQGLPILVIHHENISRGIFDRGTMPKFIHSIDLTNPSWSLSKQIRGAFKKWESDVLSNKKTWDVNADISFDESTGTILVNGKDEHHCHKCYYEKDHQLIPLKVEKWGWRCNVCKEKYRDPSYTPPPKNIRTSRMRF